MSSKQTVALLGASPKEERYANRALRALKAKGHTVLPINPQYKEIEGEKVFSKLSDIHQKIDTLTVYLSPTASELLVDDITLLHPKRVILNPGTESKVLKSKLEKENIEVLILGQFVF
jgi:hypothetical protein